MKPLRCLLLPFAAIILLTSPSLPAQDLSYDADPFRQLDEILPTPTETRLASGKPGPQYWQQRADYVISVELDDAKRRLTGAETITYHNQSPHGLNYLWVQLDQNRFRPDSDDLLARPAPSMERINYKTLKSMLARAAFQGGYDIKSVTDAADNPLPHTIVRTMMRIDLPEPLESGESTVLKISWNTTSSMPRPIARGAAMSISTKTRIASTKSPNGFRAWSPTPTTPAGRTSSFLDQVSSRWSSVITRSRSQLPPITS